MESISKSGGILSTTIDGSSTYNSNSFEKNGSVKVCLRLRPMNKLETSRRSKNCVEVHYDTDNSLTVDSPLDGEFDFTFDKVFDDIAPQEDIHETVGIPAVEDFLDGYNTCIMVYGQTGTGKTHTMMGVGAGAQQEPCDEPQTGKKEDVLAAQTLSSENSITAHTGLIPRIIRQLFHQMSNSPANIEYIVRCSYIELYLDKMLDLLDPSARNLYVPASEDTEPNAAGSSKGFLIHNASECCCHTENDIVSLLVRGNACRYVASARMNTDSSRSHVIFIVRVEQRDDVTGVTRHSTMSLMDMAGSELSSNTGGSLNRRMSHRKSLTNASAVDSDSAGAPSNQQFQEAFMINQSLSSLNELVKHLSSQKKMTDSKSSLNELYRASKLTSTLRDALGGNCLTSVIITASPSSYNIQHTINTIRFGQRAMRIANTPTMNVMDSASYYKREWVGSELHRNELKNFVVALARECCTLRELIANAANAKGGKTDDQNSGYTFSGPMWGVISTILEGEEANGGGNSVVDSLLISAFDESPKPKPHKSNAPNCKTCHTPSTDPESSVSQTQEIKSLKAQLAAANQAREMAENAVSEIQTEVAVLRSQKEHADLERKTHGEEFLVHKNEIFSLKQVVSEMETQLKVSTYRENEATVFLRQFRRFYRRLLRNKAAQGTGDTTSLISKVPGVPDLGDLIDIDSLLYESGLIEESELYDDGSVSDYQPSKDAMEKSTSQAQGSGGIAEENMFESAGDKVNETMPEICFDNQNRITTINEEEEEFSLSNNKNAGNKDADRLSVKYPSNTIDGSDAQSDTGSTTSSISHQSSNTAISQSFRPPSRLPPNQRELQLQRDLREMTDKCIDLQIALNEEKSNVDVLTNRSGSLSKKRLAQEAITLRQALDRKTHDLQAIIWKMNELHLINKTYHEKVTNRDMHVQYLEDATQDIQNVNRTLIADKRDAENKLHSQLDNLHVLVDAMTIPLWQFGECDVGGSKNISSRIVLPIRGCRLDMFAANSTSSSPQQPPPAPQQEAIQTMEGKQQNERAEQAQVAVDLDLSPTVDVIRDTSPKIELKPAALTAAQRKQPVASTKAVVSPSISGGNTNYSALQVAMPPSKISQRIQKFGKISEKAAAFEKSPAASQKTIGGVSGGGRRFQPPPKQINVQKRHVPITSRDSDDDSVNTMEQLLEGGRPESFVPQRFSRKLGPMILPAVVKNPRNNFVMNIQEQNLVHSR